MSTGASRADRFDELVIALRKALGPSSGLTSDDVDTEFLSALMKDYDSVVDKKWSKYAFADASRAYTRNLVDEGNGKCNLVRGNDACLLVREANLSACSGLDSREGKPHPRPRQCPLSYEDSKRSLDRDSICISSRGPT